MSYHLVNGPSERIRFPVGGPYDQRLGYNAIPQYVQNLHARGFDISKQAQLTPSAERFAARHGYSLYHEKTTAGLQLRDRNGFAEIEEQIVSGKVLDFLELQAKVEEVLPAAKA